MNESTMLVGDLSFIKNFGQCGSIQSLMSRYVPPMASLEIKNQTWRSFTVISNFPKKDGFDFH
jgi:hypothetical protein